MKYRASNTKRRRGANSVSLFPFLAVLICTMGVLILLLVIITHQARLQAAQEALDNYKFEEDETVQQQADVRWRIELLKESRQKTKKQLDEVRLRLGLIEDHSRKLAENLRRLETTRKQLEQSKADGQERRQIEKELAETKDNIARVEADIEETRRQIKRQTRSFRPTIPYEGAGGTMRIPICVECRGDAIVIQPEGVELTEDDFVGPLGPGNPLAAALRAAREHLLAKMGGGLGGGLDGGLNSRLNDADIDGIEPYPLLLVRPDGTHSYNAARVAMKSWGPDFGYELIDADWEIAYGSPNPELAQAMQEAIDAARLHQVRLAASAPKHYPGHGSATADGRRYTASRRGGVVAYRGPTRESHYRTPGERLALQRSALGKTAHGGSPTGDGSGTGVNMQISTGERETPPSRERRPGEWAPSDPRHRPSKLDQHKPDGDKRPRHKPGSLATARGKDWGLPGSTPRSTPLPRPIRIECHHDRLVVVPERGLSGRREVALDARTSNSIDEFVSAIWHYIDKSWGIAGNRMYWRPILKVEVAPGAEGRYDDLKALLDESGLEVRRKIINTETRRHGERRME